MAYKDYLESCLLFAEDTKEWLGLVENSFYTTNELVGWSETCDNQHGGLSVKWAFHKPISYIKMNAFHEFLYEIANLIELACDDSWSYDDIRKIAELLQ